MQSHAGKILLVAKLTAGFSIPALIAAGMARAPLRRWLVVLHRRVHLTGALVLAGVYLTESIVRVGQGLHLPGHGRADQRRPAGDRADRPAPPEHGSGPAGRARGRRRP
jgi:hypothetical protein